MRHLLFAFDDNVADEDFESQPPRVYQDFAVFGVNPWSEPLDETV